MRLDQGISHGITRRRFAMLLLIAAAACARKGVEQEDMDPRPDPIPLHVRNENYLDMNVYVLVNGVQRRLGIVSGNSQQDFRIEWSMVNSQSFAVLATPIGGRGTASTGLLNVGPDQMIEFRIAQTIRQSGVSVHDRP
jgi:hypothetical protein